MKSTIFGTNLAQLRKAARYSQKELAEQLGINLNTYIGYETAGREPRFETLIKIADFFGVSTDKLLRDSNSDESDSKRQALSAAILNLSDEKRIVLAELAKVASELTGTPQDDGSTDYEVKINVARKDEQDTKGE